MAAVQEIPQEQVQEITQVQNLIVAKQSPLYPEKMDPVQRGAFIELFGIEEKDADGNKVDNTTEDASVTNNTSVMMSTVAGNEYAIGYISLGSLNDSVKAVKIDGNEATVDNIKSGTYKISRPFNIVTKDGLSDVAQDFIDYILSSDGQGVIEKNGYIKNSDNGAYAGSKPKGKSCCSRFFFRISGYGKTERSLHGSKSGCRNLKSRHLTQLLV